MGLSAVKPDVVINLSAERWSSSSRVRSNGPKISPDMVKLDQYAVFSLVSGGRTPTRLKKMLVITCQSLFCSKRVEVASSVVFGVARYED